MTMPDPIEVLIRTALADLQPRIEIARANQERAQREAETSDRVLSELLEQDQAYRDALPTTEEGE